MLKMGVFGILLVFLLTILEWNVTVAIDADCNFNAFLNTNQDYSFNSKGYPNKYPKGTSCLWWLQSDVNTKIYLSCTVNMPATTNCQGDKLRVSLSGDATNFYDAKNYCGVGSFSLISTANVLAVGLFATLTSTGGTFTCNVKAQPTAPPACDCGWKRGTRIVGGQPTGVNEYPMMAGLLDTSIKDDAYSLGEVICGCTILTNRYVITAAHCMSNIANGNMAVLVGNWNTSTSARTAATALYGVSGYVIHPQFQANTQINDLAIVKTSQTIVFSLYVGPVCLPFSYRYESFVNQIVTLLGWGQIFFNGPQSDVLEKVNVQVIQNTYCQQQYTGNTITDNQMCTYASGKDACQRDSGGPVLWEDVNGRQYLAAIISYGLGCATTKPGVNSRVTKYLDWIVSVISDTNFCVK